MRKTKDAAPERGGLLNAVGRWGATKREPVPTRGHRESAQQPSRKGRKQLAFWQDALVVKELKALAVEQGMTQQALMSEAINLVFKKYGKPPIASA